jgi:hypothetical protein
MGAILSWSFRERSCHLAGMAAGRGAFLLVLVSFGWAGSAVSAPVAPAIPVSIDLIGLRGCSDAGAFFRALKARIDRVQRTASPDEGVRLVVRLAQVSQNTVQGELRVRDAQGNREVRKVEGASCGEVVEVLSLTAALAIDRTAAAAPFSQPAAPVPPGAAVAAAAAPASAPPVAGASGEAGKAPPGPAPSTPAPPAPADEAPPRSSRPQPDTAAERSPPREPAPVHATAELPPGVARDANSASAPPPPSSAARSWGASIGAAAMGAGVVSPYLSLGGGASFRVGAYDQAGVGPSLGLALFHLPNDLLGSSPDVAVGWTAASLTGCPGGWQVGSRVRLVPCAQAIGGWLTASGRTVSNPRSVARSWWSLGGLVRAALTLGGGFVLEADVGVARPLMERRFVTTTPDRTVGETRSVSVLVGVGIVRNL